MLFPSKALAHMMFLRPDNSEQGQMKRCNRERLKLYFVVKAKMKTKYTQQHLLSLKKKKKSISSKSIMRFETTADSCHFTNRYG